MQMVEEDHHKETMMPGRAMRIRSPWRGKDVATESRLWAGPDKQTQSGSWKKSCLRQGFLLVELTSTADCQIQTSSSFSVHRVKTGRWAFKCCQSLLSSGEGRLFSGAWCSFSWQLGHAVLLPVCV